MLDLAESHCFFLPRFRLSLNKGMVIKEIIVEIDDEKVNVGREREGGRCYCVASCFGNSIRLTIPGLSEGG